MIWLTDSLKAKHLRELSEAESRDLDEGVLPFLAEINAFHGLVTTGCCAGHCRPIKGSDTPFSHVGYVSIRITEERNNQLELIVIPALPRQPFMDHVAKLYERDEHERLWCRFVFAFKRGYMETFVHHFRLLVGLTSRPANEETSDDE